MLADPMVGYWCRVGSLALTHTHNDIAILVQRRSLLSIFFLLFSFRIGRFSLPSMSFVCCRFLVVAECDKFARLSTVEREPVLCAWFRHSLRSPPLDSASHDLRGGAGPCRRLVGVRDEQFALFCGAHHPPRDYMDCRPGAELGYFPSFSFRDGSAWIPPTISGLDIPCGLHLSTALLMTFVAAQDPLERKCVVDVHWSPENNSNSWS